MQHKTVFKEPIYDDDMLALIEEQKTSELIRALLCYTKTLENMVLDLRREVNGLTFAGKPEPYTDLHSDIYEVFYEYPGYSKYKEIFKEILDQE